MQEHRRPKRRAQRAKKQVRKATFSGTRLVHFWEGPLGTCTRGIGRGSRGIAGEPRWNHSIYSILYHIILFSTLLYYTMLQYNVYIINCM